MKTFTEWSIEKLAKDAKLDVSKYDPKELATGYKAEKKEHDGGEGKDVDIIKKESDILKVVVAHLREDPNYYKKLEKAKL